MATAPPLITAADVTGRLGRDLTDAENARAPALMNDASVLIRRYCRQDFLHHEDDTAELRADGAVVKLPGPPVQKVSKVLALSGIDGIPDFPVTWWRFNGIDEVMIGDPEHSGVINLPAIWWDLAYGPQTFTVTYSHGPEEVPEDVVMVAANAVCSVFTSPTQASGVIGETVGAYSYRLESGGAGVAVSLKPSDYALLDDYRDKAVTVRTVA
ncbi:MAG: hypothetical protein FWE15_02115 [Actinomycetia bacterium]|nr:hypothetical protein [Actinomycetes bacterium]